MSLSIRRERRRGPRASQEVRHHEKTEVEHRDHALAPAVDPPTSPGGGLGPSRLHHAEEHRDRDAHISRDEQPVDDRQVVDLRQVEADRKLRGDAGEQPGETDAYTVGEIPGRHVEQGGRDQEGEDHRNEHRPDEEDHIALHADDRAELRELVHPSRQAVDLARRGHFGHPLAFEGLGPVETEHVLANPEDHLLRSPHERRDLDDELLSVERETAEIQVRAEGGRETQMVAHATVRRDRQDAVGDVRRGGVHELDLRLPDLGEPGDGGVREEVPVGRAFEGQSLVVPTQAQIEVGLEGLVPLVDRIEVEEVEADLHDHGTVARRKGDAFLLRSGEWAGEQADEKADREVAEHPSRRRTCAGDVKASPSGATDGDADRTWPPVPTSSRVGGWASMLTTATIWPRLKPRDGGGLLPRIDRTGRRSDSTRSSLVMGLPQRTSVRAAVRSNASCRGEAAPHIERRPGPVIEDGHGPHLCAYSERRQPCEPAAARDLRRGHDGVDLVEVAEGHLGDQGDALIGGSTDCCDRGEGHALDRVADHERQFVGAPLSGRGGAAEVGDDDRPAEGRPIREGDDADEGGGRWLGAGAPGGQKEAEVGAIGDAAAVDVGGAALAPPCEQQAEIGAVDHAVAVEVGGAGSGGSC